MRVLQLYGSSEVTRLNGHELQRSFSEDPGKNISIPKMPDFRSGTMDTKTKDWCVRMIDRAITNLCLLIYRDAYS